MHESSYGYRRAYQRFSCFLKGTCESSDSKVHEVACNDISYKGAGIITDSPLAINGHLKMQLFNLKVDSMNVEGRVRWCRNVHGKWCAGVLFDKGLPFELEKVI